MDSNVSSVGTLEVLNPSYISLSPSQPTFSQYTTLLATLPMLWDPFRPTPTIGPGIRLGEYARTAGISLTRMDECAIFVG
jgi:hypothetical protein